MNGTKELGKNCCFSTPCYISLGSNMGDRQANLARAINLLEQLGPLPELPEVLCPYTVLEASAVYFTEPQNLKNQDFFANQVLKLGCAPGVEPVMLLHRLFEVENRMGRVRQVRFGPRVIDLDLLLFGNIVIRTQELVLPHPRMHERAFVLVPLLDVAPDLAFSGCTAQEFLRSLDYRVENGYIYQTEPM